MKKYANFNMVTILTAAAVLLIMAVCALAITNNYSESLAEIKNDIAEASSSEEIGDVEGYGMIINSAAYGFGTLSNLLIKIIFIKIPAVFGIVISCLALITRFIFRKNILCSILTIINYILIFISDGLYSLAFMAADDIKIKIAALVFMIYIIFITAVGLRNAFSKNIK